MIHPRLALTGHQEKLFCSEKQTKKSNII